VPSVALTANQFHKYGSDGVLFVVHLDTPL
jgi:hypothetical protein